MLRERRITPIRKARLDASLANPLRVDQQAFVEWTRVVGLAEQTALIRKFALDHFIRWCDGRAVNGVEEIDRKLLEQYQAFLFRYRKVNGRPLALTTQVARLNPLKAFCKWLVRTERIPFNPAADLLIPFVPRRLPGRVLTASEIKRVLARPDLGTPSGIRDRAILEVLYSTGMRRMELVRIELGDVLLEQQTLFIRRGKGGRDRVLPLGKPATDWLSRYL